MAIVAANGGRFGYDDTGSGPVVVLVHAGLADRRMWDHQFADLSRDHRVIRYDWRGYGESSDLTDEVAHHEDLLALLDALDVDRATLVGASMGGAYALDAAIAAPERVSALVLVCAVFSGHAWPPSSLALMASAFEDVDRSDPVAMATANVDLMVAGPGRSLDDLDPVVRARAVELCTDVFRREAGGQQHHERQLEPPAAGRLGEVLVPTLVVNGLEDLDGVQQAATALTAGISGARRLDLPATGHLPSVERPVQLTAALRRS